VIGHRAYNELRWISSGGELPKAVKGRDPVIEHRITLFIRKGEELRGEMVKKRPRDKSLDIHRRGGRKEKGSNQDNVSGMKVSWSRRGGNHSTW